METTEKNIDVKKSNGGNRDKQDIPWLILSCLIPIYFIYQAFKNGTHWTMSFGTISLIVCILYFFVFSAYGFDNYFDKKSVIRIDQLGIFTKKYGQVMWQDIYDVQTNSYPGPRMEFYKIKYWLTDGKTVHTIRFTSDITCKFNEIIETLSFYTIQNNIRMTT